MNNKQTFRAIALLLSTAALSMAQQQGTAAGGTPGPASALWGLARMLLGCVGAVFVIALIYHSMMAKLGDRASHIAKIGDCVLWAGVAFSAYGIMTVVQGASLMPF